MKLFLISNIVWLVIASGAFFFGRDSAESDADGDVAKGNRSSTNGTLTWTGSPGNEFTPGSSGSGLRSLNRGDFPASADRGALLASALDEKDPIQRKLKLYELLANLTASDIPSVLAAFEQAGKGEDIDGAYRDFMLAWGRIDGAAALEYALHNDDGRKVSYGSTNAMTGWASQNPDAAKAYLDTVEPGGTKQWLHYGVMKALVENNLGEAIAFSETNTKSNARGRAMDLIASRLMETEGAPGLRRWLDGIDHTGENEMTSYKNYAFRTALNRISRENPELATSWIVEASGQPYVSSDTIRSVASRANEGNPVEALSWLASIPESRQQREAVTESVERLARENPNEAAAWLNDQPLGPELDPALYSFTRTISESDPRAAVEWAGMIQNDRNRSKATVRAARHWIRREPDAARAWIDRQSFSQEDLQSILR